MSNRSILFGSFLLVACAVSSPSSSAHAGSIFQYLPSTNDGSETAGGIVPPKMMQRRLREDGYKVLAAPTQKGAVYFVRVVKKTRRLCLMLDAFTGTVLQSFRYTPSGLVALIKDSPGPGYPGYPAVSDGRYTAGCVSHLKPPHKRSHRIAPRRKHVAPHKSKHPMHRFWRRPMHKKLPTCIPAPPHTGDPKPSAPPHKDRAYEKGSLIHAQAAGICHKSGA